MVLWLRLQFDSSRPGVVLFHDFYWIFDPDRDILALGHSLEFSPLLHGHHLGILESYVQGTKEAF